MGKILTLHDPHSARAHYLSGAWQNDTLYGLLAHHATVRGDAFALRDGVRRLTWAQLRDWVDAVAHDLDTAGVRRGDRVAVWLPNRVESMVTLLACGSNGYMCNPSLHQNYTVEEIVMLLQRIDCTVLVTQVGHGADAHKASVFDRLGDIASLKRCFALPRPGTGSDVPAGTVPFPASRALAAARAPDTDPDKVMYLAFTSGTTGLPKGVMHTDNTLLANGRAMVADWGHDENTVLVCLSPMSHHISTVALEQTLVCGCEMVMTDPRAGRSAIDWIVETGATYVMGVPTHGMDILQAMQDRDLTALGKVRVFYMAGAPIPKETANRFLTLGIKPQNVYGMTENGSHQYTLPTDTAEVITGTCGKACKGYEVKLWSQENPNVEAAPGEVGEIGGRGGVLMLDYFGNQGATESTFNEHGWMMSGDLGRFDAHGNLQIVGRKKDLIIRGGHNIHPARIEDLAYRHAAVTKAAAFPVADERLGEKVCLALICAGTPPTGDEMLLHLDREGLSKFDMPEYFVVLPEFPLTPSGKILKRELIEWTKAGRIAPTPVRFKATSQEAR